MSILIKGMDMPKNCSTCPFYICDEEEWCVVLREYISHSKYCPLVEVKTPHGRLIDADKLLEVLDKTQKEFEADTFGDLHIDYISDEFNDAPTVIEAEDE